MKLIALSVGMVLLVNYVAGEECIPVATGGDCREIYKANPSAKSGVYWIKVPGKSSPVHVYCDMDTDCGGWTVFQRRKDGSENFKRPWFDYQIGFGNLTGEFWLGNEYVSALTNARPYRLRIDLVNWVGVHSYAEYNYFKVAGVDAKYQLTFKDGSYYGDAGDAMTGTKFGPGTQGHNGMKFSTIDQDNDNNAASCSALCHGGWWYNACHSANMNGLYNNTNSGQGINWDDREHSMIFTEMKIR